MEPPHLPLYEANGLLFWTEQHIELREQFASMLVRAVSDNLKTQNRGFEVIRCEAPVLLPAEMMSRAYEDKDVYWVTGGETDAEFMTFNYLLRPETTQGSYAYLEHLLNPHAERKVKLPCCVWQHGLSFRREQDQPTKFMRLKQFYQLELQCAFNITTAKDYQPELAETVRRTIAGVAGEAALEPSDRLPSYSEETVDVVVRGMEVCSISRRTDFSDDVKVIEIAVGTDRLVHQHLLSL